MCCKMHFRRLEIDDIRHAYIWCLYTQYSLFSIEIRVYAKYIEIKCEKEVAKKNEQTQKFEFPTTTTE